MSDKPLDLRDVLPQSAVKSKKGSPMRPVSERTFHPISWPNDTPHSKQHRKDDKNSAPVSQPQETQVSQPTPKVTRAAPVSVYNSHGVVGTDDPSLGKNVDSKA